MAVTLTVSCEVNSQNIANNTSNITVTVRASYTGGSYNKTYKSGYVTIDGTKYTFTAPFNTGQVSSGVATLHTRTVNVTHASDGSKQDMYIYASYETGVSSGTIAASAYVDLPTIPRKSTLSVANGTLGKAQTLTVTKQASAFTHTIKATCGTASSTICTKSSSTSISFTPPLSWASQNTTGTMVSVKYEIATYNGNTSVGANSYTKSCMIPESVKPECAITVSDATNYFSVYGGYVVSKSKLRVQINGTPAYGSPIASYWANVSLGGGTSWYDAQTFTTAEIDRINTTILATVADKRNRVGEAIESITAIDYSAPIINSLAVKRCNEDGTENAQGEYVQVRFSSALSSLNGKNTAKYTLGYKKTSESDYTSIELTDYSDNLAVSDGTYIFEADTGSSYNVLVTITDAFETSYKTTTVSTAFTLIHWLASGLGIAFGKIAELAHVLDIGFQTRFAGGILHPVLEPETDLNDVRTPNTYVGANVTTYNYANCPLTSGTFTLEVVGMGDAGQVKQRITYCHKTDAKAYERIYYQSGWGEWVCVSNFAGTLLWEGAHYMHTTQSITLAEPISKQRTGIVLVWSRYKDEAIERYRAKSCHFIPKILVADGYAPLGTGDDHKVPMAFNICCPFGADFATKGLMIGDTTISASGYFNKNDADTFTGDNGIVYSNKNYVLTYVIGV